MQHTGMLFLSRARPQVGRAKDGVFQIQLMVYDRLGQHQTETWRITYSGAAAQRFWDQHEADLKPGCALQVELEDARTHTIYTRPPVAEIRAKVVCMQYLPRTQSVSAAVI